MKNATIILSYPHLSRDPKLDIASSTEDQRFVYHVEKVKNSTAYSPGQYLMKGTVQALCESDTWDVTINTVGGK